MSLENDLVALFRAEPHIQLGILFGSLSRGTGNADSDVDIAVAADRVLTQQEITNLIEKIAARVGRPVDLVDLQTMQEPIFHHALTTGRVIYCINRSLLASLLKRAIFDEADFLRYRDRALRERRKRWIGV
jgi:predicted nucleotidyltransferase